MLHANSPLHSLILFTLASSGPRSSSLFFSSPLLSLSLSLSLPPLCPLSSRGQSLIVRQVTRVGDNFHSHWLLFAFSGLKLSSGQMNWALSHPHPHPVHTSQTISCKAHSSVALLILFFSLSLFFLLPHRLVLLLLLLSLSLSLSLCFASPQPCNMSTMDVNEHC